MEPEHTSWGDNDSTTTPWNSNTGFMAKKYLSDRTFYACLLSKFLLLKQLSFTLIKKQIIILKALFIGSDPYFAS